MNKPKPKHVIILIAVIGIALGLFSPAAAGTAATTVPGNTSFHFAIDFSSTQIIWILSAAALLFLSLALLSHPAAFRKRNLIHH